MIRELFLWKSLTRTKNVGITVRLVETVNWVKADRATMAGNPKAKKLCCPVPAIVVNQALNVIPLGGHR
ncbi:MULTISPECIES: hypothetical protein [Rhizobium]|jgi:hypothetical protein|uniref:hypothetical protein n=1 Tax=Rhizobium TaxID=379 RepID=UPI000F73E579|nr:MULTISPECIES: hypothetical protein [Rhizobium]RSB91825.1 hypothetical protein EFR00_25210 [Rhizobium sophoriradicis]UWU33252.1 hypothetical protein N2597_13885 [Rhizobium leguminosarum bv. phaseoli]